MRVLIFNDHFFPAQQSGGITQSIHNITALLGNKMSFFVVCSAYEYGTGAALDIEINQWTDFNGSAEVIYLSSQKISIGTYSEILNDIKPDLIYLNGVFSKDFVLKPLLAIGKRYSHKVIIAPRGMLQAGALAIKPLKKKVFLALFKMFSPIGNYRWHATDNTEIQDIEKFVGSKKKVCYAPVLPILPPFEVREARFYSVETEVRICTVSLITSKKGIDAAIRAISAIKSSKKIIYHIYGPVKDSDYWNKCKDLMPHSSEHIEVKYMGIVAPVEVFDLLGKYHLFILPTAGENFGHAIFEALSSGLPVLISSKTPFSAVEAKNAGGVRDNHEGLVNWLQHSINKLSVQDWLESSLKSREFAESFFAMNRYEESYLKLFSTGNENL